MGYSQTKYPYVDTNLFDVNFTLGYISQSDVFVYVTGEVDGEGEQIFRDYDWVTDSRLRVIGDLEVGDEVVLQRIVSKQNLVADFKDGTLDREALQNSFRQTMMALHEVADGVLADNVAVLQTPAEIDAALTFIIDNSDAIINIGGFTPAELAALSDATTNSADAAIAAQVSAETAATTAATAQGNSETARDAAEAARDDAEAAALTASANSVTSGIWTPIVSDGSTATVTGTDGLYSRVGDMVTVSFHIRGISKGNIGTSSLFVSGLPYSARNLTNSQLQFLGVFNQSGISGVLDAQLRLDENTSSILFKKAATIDNAGLVTGTDMPTSGAALNGTLTYFTDDPV